MLTRLRTELNALLLQAEPTRRPALRRADSDQWLFATDIPLLLAPGQLSKLEQLLADTGWQYSLKDGWLYLDHPIALPEQPPESMPDGACGCVVSVLHRHPGESRPAEAMIRRLAKASEQGSKSLETVCSAIHGELAVMLRQREALPSGLLPYVLVAYDCAKHRVKH